MSTHDPNVRLLSPDTLFFFHSPSLLYSNEEVPSDLKLFTKTKSYRLPHDERDWDGSCEFEVYPWIPFYSLGLWLKGCLWVLPVFFFSRGKRWANVKRGSLVPKGTREYSRPVV